MQGLQSSLQYVINFQIIYILYIPYVIFTGNDISYRLHLKCPPIANHGELHQVLILKNASHVIL